jgi:uncharacterized protein YjbI with pentapeptide repeats
MKGQGKMDIKRAGTDQVLYSCELESFKEVLEKANLECVDLEGANLKCVDLEGANLKGADIC